MRAAVGVDISTVRAWASIAREFSLAVPLAVCFGNTEPDVVLPVIDLGAVGHQPVPASTVVAVLDKGDFLTTTPSVCDLAWNEAGTTGKIGSIGLRERVPSVSATALCADK